MIKSYLQLKIELLHGRNFQNRRLLKLNQCQNLNAIFHTIMQIILVMTAKQKKSATIPNLLMQDHNIKFVDQVVLIYYPKLTLHGKYQNGNARKYANNPTYFDTPYNE